MAEYIEREALMLNFESRYRNYRQRSETPIGGGCVEVNRDLQMAAVVMKSCLDTIHDVPAADVVEVVRCKDCIHYELGVCLKIYSDGNVSADVWQERKPDDFCSYGERKNSDERP